MKIDDAALADQYIRESHDSHHNDHIHTAADLFYDMVNTDVPHALAIIDLIMSRTDDQQILATIGAGLLEDILNSKAGSTYVDQIIVRARQDKNWRFAFGCIWSAGIVDKPVRQKMEESYDKYFSDTKP